MISVTSSIFIVNGYGAADIGDIRNYNVEQVGAICREVSGKVGNRVQLGLRRGVGDGDGRHTTDKPIIDDRAEFGVRGESVRQNQRRAQKSKWKWV